MICCYCIKGLAVKQPLSETLHGWHARDAEMFRGEKGGLWRWGDKALEERVVAWQESRGEMGTPRASIHNWDEFFECVSRVKVVKKTAV